MVDENILLSNSMLRQSVILVIKDASNITQSDLQYTYLLTPWSRVLLEKLTGFAASQQIPRIYGTRKFITVFTSVRHLSLS
jgi:hypothetical protein